MKMIYKALLSIIILAWFYSNCFSQATLSIGTANGTPGNSISIPIQATGIVDMTGFQFTIAYDKTKLTYVSCTNWITGLNATQVQINPLDGKLTFVYTDAAINIANGKFFDLNFTVLNGTSGDAAISWSDSPTQRELSNSIPNEISCVYSNGAVVISVASLLAPVATAATNIAQTSFSANWNSSATATGYRLDVALDNGFINFLTGYQNKDVGNVTTHQISGCVANTIYYYRVKAYNTEITSGVSNIINGTTLSNQNGATLTISNVSGTAGNLVSIPVAATNLYDVVGFQFTIDYDKTKLTYLSCTNWATGINATQVQINSLDGKLTFVYTDAAINIANGKFFDLNFTVLSGTSGDAAISWSDSPTQRELSNSIPNEISCEYSNGAVVITGTSFLAPVAAAATNIAQTSFSANWNSSATATGYRLDVALDNGFTNYLTGYQNKDVGNVTSLLISGCLANTIYYYRVKAYNTEITSGVSNIINVTTPSNQNVATLTISNVSGTAGNLVSIPVTATNFYDVVGFQFKIAYDKTKLTYINCTNWATGLNAAQVQINPLDGKITFVYTDAAINIANGKFFDLNFTVLSGTSGDAAISWSDSPTQRELSNSIPNEISCEYSNGNVAITGNTDPEDFYIQNVSVTPNAVEAGNIIEVSCDQCYSGSKTNANMGYVYLGYYLSTNTSFSSSTDILLGSDYSGLGIDEKCNSENAELIIPAGTTPGTYFILFVADHDGRFTEENEANNVLFQQITIRDTCSLTFSQVNLDISDSLGSYPVTIFTNSNWTITNKPDWIVISVTSGFGNRNATITVDENQESFRTGKITLAACNSEITLTVNQAANPLFVSVEVLVQGPIKVYPNPTSGIVTIEGLPENEKAEISVYDMNRKLIKREVSSSAVAKIDISDAVSGTYLLVVNNHFEQAFKIIKE